MKWTKAELLKNHNDCKKAIKKLKSTCYDKMEIALVDLLLKEHKQLLQERIELQKMLGGKKMNNKETLQIIIKITERADNMGLLMDDRISLLMDLECVPNLRLNDLLNADEFNFAHDICGIQKNLNRQTKKIENFFVPRFAR